MKRSFFGIITLSWLLFSCGGNNVDVAIDNPTNEAFVVSIDTLMVEVPAREVVWVEMGKGEHSITLPNDSLVKFNFTQDVYMLNPSLTEYLMYEEFYGSEFYQSSHVSSIPNQTVNYLGMEVEGNYAIVKDLVNAVTWDYGPREAMPEMIEMDADENYAALIKIADPIEIINQMSSRMPEEEVYEDVEVEQEYESSAE